MKKFTLVVVLLITLLITTSCSSGISQEEYDAVVAERDELLEQLEEYEYSESVVLEVVPENTPEPTAKPDEFDEAKVVSQLEISNYNWNSSRRSYVAIVVKNNSEFTTETDVKVIYKDGDGNIIGADNSTERAHESGYDICFVFNNEDEFASYEYEISVSEDTYYTPVQSQISAETNITDKKAIIMATNEGEIVAEFASYVVLFMNGDQVVEYGSGYVTDDDAELKPGKTEFREESCRETFDSVKVFLTGRNDS